MSIKELIAHFGNSKLPGVLRILVACEESQAVTKELRKLGHEAFSCDLLPSSGLHPEWHLQQDVTEILGLKWDMIIAFPPCTYLTVSGNRWFSVEKYGEQAIKRHKDRQLAVSFFKMIADADCDFIAIENPVGIMSTEWRKPDQIINPYQFGDPFEKKTCLWLKGLPKLESTNIVTPPKRIDFASGKTMATWYNDSFKLPKDERSRLRSKTFEGIAKNIAVQFTCFIKSRLSLFEWDNLHISEKSRIFAEYL
jgi:site-specific DNA-cytosine methylase